MWAIVKNVISDFFVLLLSGSFDITWFVQEVKCAKGFLSKASIVRHLLVNDMGEGTGQKCGKV